MPIRVKCVCQQQFDAPDNLAGKTVKCPKCASPITIPISANKPAAAARPAPVAPNAMASLLDEAGVKQRSAAGCPACGAAFPPDAVLCVECGFNFRTGRKLETKFVATSAMDAVVGHGVNAEFLIEKALRDQEAEKALQKKMVNFGIPWWGYLLILIGVVLFIVGMGSLPQNVAMQIAGWTLIVAAILIGVACEIWIKVIAFKDSATQGILVFIFPPYELYYVFTHWDECAFPWLLGFASSFIAGMGYGALVLAPMLGQSETEVSMQFIQMIVFV